MGEIPLPKVIKTCDNPVVSSGSICPWHWPFGKKKRKGRIVKGRQWVEGKKKEHKNTKDLMEKGISLCASLLINSKKVLLNDTLRVNHLP